MTNTPTSLRERLASAQAREREARAAAARIRRELAAADRRRETQLLCTLGRAWLALGERNANFRESGMRFLSAYITRPADHAALAGTAWELPPPAPAHAPASDQGGDHDR